MRRPRRPRRAAPDRRWHPHDRPHDTGAADATEANTEPARPLLPGSRAGRASSLYLALGVAILSLTRVITGAGQLTAESTFRSAL